MVAASCRTFLCVDVTQSAPAYATLAGALAGFAGLAIILLLQRRGDRGHEAAGAGTGAVHGLENVLISFTTAFVASIVAAFLFSQLAREETPSSRVMVLGLLASLALTAAVLILFHGVVWMFRTWGLERAALVTARITGLVLPPLIFLYMAALGLDQLAFQEGHRPTGTWLGVLLLVLLAALVCVVVAVAKSPALRSRAGLLGTDRAVRAAAYLAVSIAAAAAIASGVVGELGLGVSLHREGVAALMVGLFAVLCLYAFLIQGAELAEEGREP